LISLQYNNLDNTASFHKLKNLDKRIDLKSFLTPERIRTYSIETGGKLSYNYAAMPVDEEIISLLQDLAEEQQLVEKYRALLSGEIMNTGENRKVLHHLLRGQLAGPVTYQGRDLRDFYISQQKRIFDFADKVHSGEIKGSTGKLFDTVVQIGIGGSDLGPRALHIALAGYAYETFGKPRMNARFISNVDPDDANCILHDLDPERCLFIIVSKSGTTQETLTNRQLVIEKMNRRGIAGLDPRKHMIAVTSETSPMAGSSEYLDSFFIDDFIGGRYSATSAVGGVILTLSYGREVFQSLLNGAHQSDKNALESDIRKNASLMDALIGVYLRNILLYPVTAVLPYSQALSRFPAHLQQLDMESNGKSVNRFGKPLNYPTGPVVFGEPGTNGQHSFYQLLHQGTDLIPLQFIGFKEPQYSFNPEIEGFNCQQKLIANLSAQIVAFAMGKDDSDPNKKFPGNRPSSLIFGERLNPEALGALLAHFENKIMFQGFTWNINSFDQEGVQLGKTLTRQILGGKSLDPLLEKYSTLLGIRK